jgi:hypothetical protein
MTTSNLPTKSLADRNQLNNLNGKEWVAFTKSWFIINPKRRNSIAAFHPAKYPESLVYDFLKFFTRHQNEKLLDTHIAQITIWAECSQDSAVVTFHGWNNRDELKALLQEPNAVQPNGNPMPKPCKRMLSNKWRKMNDLITAIHRISPTDTSLTIGLISQQQ